jgi:hypothetical protein
MSKKKFEKSDDYDFTDIISAIPKLKERRDEIKRNSILSRTKPLIEGRKIKGNVDNLPYITQMIVWELIDEDYSYGQWLEYCRTTPLLDGYDEQNRASYAYNLMSGIKNGQSMQEIKIEIIADFMNMDLVLKPRPEGKTVSMRKTVK